MKASDESQLFLAYSDRFPVAGEVLTEDRRELWVSASRIGHRLLLAPRRNRNVAEQGVPLHQDRLRPADAVEQLVGENTESYAELERRVGASDLLAPLEFPDRYAMDFGPKAKLFLAHLGGVPKARKVYPERLGEFPVPAPE
ncbi:MAG TPA: hypothetical protein VGG40_05750 [Solirubrobacterales bacterium]